MRGDRQIQAHQPLSRIYFQGTFIGGCNDGPEGWMGLTKTMKSGKFAELLLKK